MDIQKIIQEGIDHRKLILADNNYTQQLEKAVSVIVECYRKGGKVLFCGNGGSAADAQHLAAELSGRFYFDRPPLDAEALHVNTSYLTAVGNDYSFDEIFARLVKARGKPGDVLVALSTSGNSANVLKAIDVASSLGMFVIGMTGSTGGHMAAKCSILLKAPTQDTPRVQEIHITLGHIICQGVEESLFGNGNSHP